MRSKYVDTSPVQLSATSVRNPMIISPKCEGRASVITCLESVGV